MEETEAKTPATWSVAPLAIVFGALLAVFVLLAFVIHRGFELKKLRAEYAQDERRLQADKERAERDYANQEAERKFREHKFNTLAELCREALAKNPGTPGRHTGCNLGEVR